MSRKQKPELVNRLPEPEITPAARFPESLIHEEEPPVDSEMLARIDAARANPAPGIPHEEILREFGV
jgi:hypothetical protein